MSKGEDVTDSSGEERDNLAEIDGIGERYAAALARAGVRSFSDLIKYTPKTLSELLQEQAGTKVTEKRIDSQNWIGQARLALGRRKLPAKRLIIDEDERVPVQEVWQERATFQVTFEAFPANGEEIWQTRVYDDHSGDETTLAGVNADTWAQWIIEQAGLKDMDKVLRHEMQEGLEHLRSEIEQLRDERDKLAAALAGTQTELERQNTQVEKLQSDLIEGETALDAARTEAAANAKALKSVRQQAQMQIDAALRVAAGVQATLSDVVSGQTATNLPHDSKQISPTPNPDTEVDQPNLRVSIQQVSVEENTAPVRNGSISFMIEGRQSNVITRMKMSCIIEVRGINPTGNSSTLLAKVNTQLSVNQSAYVVPFVLHIPDAGPYTLHTKLSLKTVGGIITALHESEVIVI